MNITRARHIVSLMAASALLAACNQPAPTADDTVDNVTTGMSEPNATPTAAKPADSPQLAADLAEIDKSCRRMGNATDTLCSCVVEEARKLSADELALTVAQLTGDAMRADAVRPKLDIMGLSRGGGFMTQAPYACEG